MTSPQPSSLAVVGLRSAAIEPQGPDAAKPREPRWTTLLCLPLAALLLAGCATAPTRLDDAQPSYRLLSRSDLFEAEESEAIVDTEEKPYQLHPPYSLERVLSTFNDCRGRRQHRGLDLAGVGEDLGLGTPVLSMAKSVVTLLGTPDTDPQQFGTWDKRDGMTERAKTMLPRSKEIEGYGKVYFFSRKSGSWNSGVVVVARIVGGPLDGYQLRYMHLAAVHPELQVGSVLEAGQELGLMGGTAIRSSSPHVHLDLEDPLGKRVDLAPFLGLPADTQPVLCKRKRKR